MPSRCHGNGISDLVLLMRGKALAQPGEHLLRNSSDRLLNEIYHQYDHNIIDSSPVRAPDDTIRLASRLTGLCSSCDSPILRLGWRRRLLNYSTADRLTSPGVIVNYVDTSSPDYYYYQYSAIVYAPIACIRSRSGQPTPFNSKVQHS